MFVRMLKKIIFLLFFFFCFDILCVLATSNDKIIYYADMLIKNSTNFSDMQYNTNKLQELVDIASENNGGTVKIPAGTYYFSPGGTNVRNVEMYVIKCKDNVEIIGAGMDEINGTILKPVGNYDLPLDMFYYIDYDDNGFKEEDKDAYLINADFRDFVIDSELTKALNNFYNSGGKGFMINLFKDCDWENVMVKNTDGTGFGMDCPVNSTVTNCIAIGCGKAATSNDVGASGFGIGFGISTDESIAIINCKSYGNRKFGFFFEHQGRFGRAYSAAGSKGFIVSNSEAYGNMYNFGGERSSDVTYTNCRSYSEVPSPIYNPLGISNVLAIHFGTNSRRTKLWNVKVEQNLTDVDITKDKAVSWALNSSIIENGEGNTMFNPSDYATKAHVITFLYRMGGRPGNMLMYNETLDLSNYDDVTNNSWYSDAIYWALNNNILKPDGNTIEPNKNCTKAEFITYLWRYAGKPSSSLSTSGYTDIDDWYFPEAFYWAIENEIIDDGFGVLGINDSYTRLEIINMLYKYNNDTEQFSFEFDKSLSVDKKNKIINKVSAYTMVNNLLGKIYTNGIITSSNVNLTGNIKTGDSFTIAFANSSIFFEKFLVSVLGDIDGNGNVDNNDIILVAKHIVKHDMIKGDVYISAADVNNNENIDINDIIKIARYINN